MANYKDSNTRTNKVKCNLEEITLLENRIKNYFKNNQYAVALKESERVKKEYPKSFIASLIMGRSSMELGIYDRAYESLSEALNIKPNDAIANHQMGILFDRLGQYEDALLYYETAIRIDPYDPEFYIDLGLVYDQLQNYEKAIIQFKEVIRINPDEIEAYFRLGLLYDSLMDGENAMRYTSQAEKLAIKQKSDCWIADTQKCKKILIKRYKLYPDNFI